jgi:hypothetical protein
MGAENDKWDGADRRENGRVRHGRELQSLAWLFTFVNIAPQGDYSTKAHEVPNTEYKTIMLLMMLLLDTGRQLPVSRKGF